MNISKTVGMATTVIPIAGILIGGITFGINFKTDVDIIKEDVAHQQVVNTEVTDWLNSLPDEYDDSLLWSTLEHTQSTIEKIDMPDEYDDSYINNRVQKLQVDIA